MYLKICMTVHTCDGIFTNTGSKDFATISWSNLSGNEAATWNTVNTNPVIFMNLWWFNILWLTSRHLPSKTPGGTYLTKWKALKYIICSSKMSHFFLLLLSHCLACHCWKCIHNSNKNKNYERFFNNCHYPKCFIYDFFGVFRSNCGKSRKISWISFR